MPERDITEPVKCVPDRNLDGGIARFRRLLKKPIKPGGQAGWTLIELLVVLFVASIGTAMALRVGSSTITSARASSIIRGVHNVVAVTRAKAMARQTLVSLEIIPDSEDPSDGNHDSVDKPVDGGWTTDFEIRSEYDSSTDQLDLYLVYQDRETSAGEKYYKFEIKNGGESKIWFSPRGLAKVKTPSGDYNYVSDCKIEFSGYAYGISTDSPVEIEVTPLGKIIMGGGA